VGAQAHTLRRTFTARYTVLSKPRTRLKKGYRRGWCPSLSFFRRFRPEREGASRGVCSCMGSLQGRAAWCTSPRHHPASLPLCQKHLVQHDFVEAPPLRAGLGVQLGNACLGVTGGIV